MLKKQVFETHYYAVKSCGLKRNFVPILASEITDRRTIIINILLLRLNRCRTFKICDLAHTDPDAIFHQGGINQKHRGIITMIKLTQVDLPPKSDGAAHDFLLVAEARGRTQISQYRAELVQKKLQKDSPW